MSPSRRSFLRIFCLGLAAGASRRPAAASVNTSFPYPKSDHCDGERFFNPGGGDPRGLRALLRWQLNRKQGAWPAWVENTASPSLPTSLTGRDCAVTFVNHATFLIQLPGCNMLTDPVWSERCSPVSWTGPKRVRAPGIRFEALPRIDLVLLTHNHYDHLDLPTLQRLHFGHRPLIITTLGNRDFLAREGIDRVIELDWWQQHRFRDGLEVNLTPAQHFAARGLTDRMKTLWGGFAAATPAGRIYFAGDSGYCGHFTAIGEKFGPFDLAFIPIGAYEPRWFMEPVHCNPSDAMRIHREVRSRRSLAMHFGCFPLADDSFAQPVQDFLAARQALGIDPTEFALPEVGETRRLQLG